MKGEESNKNMVIKQQDSLAAIADELDDQKSTSKKSEQEPQSVAWKDFFRFATRKDYILMAVGSIFALANGATMPLFSLLWGGMLDSFSDTSKVVDQTKKLMLTFIYIGLGVFASGWIMIACWLITGERQAVQCRKEYLKSLLRQEIGWYDMINQAQLSSQFSSDTMAFQSAITDKIPIVLYVFAMGISGMVVAFVKGWLMALVLLSTFPVIVFSMYLYMRNVQNKHKHEESSYRVAGGLAEQALAGIKTIKMLNGEQYQSSRYDTCLGGAAKGTLSFGIYTGACTGAAFCSMLCSYALGFWFGSNCIAETQHCRPAIARQEYTSGVVFSVFFAVVIVGFNMSQLPPSLKKIAEGKSSAVRIFKIIDRESAIKNPPNGIKLQTDLTGVIEFNNVSFAYPKNKSKKILNNLTLRMDLNNISLVGESGCGKSTIMQLLMRFYDPDEGSVTIDGHDLRDIDLGSLRQVIGYVGQEPVLFDATIRENMYFSKQDATDEEIKKALKKAEAWEFVMQLQKGLDTNVGFGGGQLSGGQKQRIAIARAILRDPRIMLLDEATSALDRKNEKLIQQTLEKISEARMSITIAHRVKTVMNSDNIFVIADGRVLESGRFQDLSRFKGIKFESEDDPIQEPKLAKSQSYGSRKNIDQGTLNLQINEEDLKDCKKTLTKEQEENLEKQRLLKISQEKHSIRRVFSYARGSQFMFAIGLLATGICGAVYPVFAIFLSKMLIVMFKEAAPGADASDLDKLVREANKYALIFFLLGILALICSIIQSTIFIVIGEKMTRKIRSEVFLKMMKLPVHWHERPENSVGGLTTRLAVDTRHVKEMTTTYIYVLFQLLCCLTVGLVIAFIYQWRTSLVSLALTPFLIGAGAIRMAFRSGNNKADEKYKESSNIIMESMTNIRTVYSFGHEGVILRKFSALLDVPLNLATRNGIMSGFFYGLAQFIMFVVIALIFYLGSVFVRDNGVNPENMFVAIFAIFFAAMTVGNNSHLLPDLANCRVSAARLFLVLDSEDEEQMQVRESSKMLRSEIRGDIVLEKIVFKYETRAEYLFKDFSMKIEYGVKSAFVGTSGCGKSTILSLLLRFYEIESGNILLNGESIKDYDIHFLREQFGVVGQQPLLFNGSFRENIRYNLTLDQVTESDVENAAVQAHASDFILGYEDLGETREIASPSTNPKDKKKRTKNGAADSREQSAKPASGFDRQVGLKGSHISGGQKQRVAIARAILRKPHILLLDEATSALDSMNEKKVQDALDIIMQNKTTISIAHRLDTIRNSKRIYVFDKGRVAEEGSYDGLMAKKGYFYNLEKGVEFK